MAVACHDKTIKIIALNDRKIIKSLIGYRREVVCVKKIIHPKYGKCLISQGISNEEIKLWIKKDKIFN